MSTQRHHPHPFQRLVPLRNIRANPARTSPRPGPRLQALRQTIALYRTCAPILLLNDPAAPIPPDAQPPPGDCCLTILDGHLRAHALRSLGIARAPCIVWTVAPLAHLPLLAAVNALRRTDSVAQRARLLLHIASLCQLDPNHVACALQQPRALLLPYCNAALQSPDRPHRHAG